MFFCFFENILSMFIYVLVFELAGEGLSPTKLPRLVWCIDVYLHLPTIKYTWELPQALPLGTPSGGGLYLTVYPLSCPNTDTVLYENTDYIKFEQPLFVSNINYPG